MAPTQPPQDHLESLKSWLGLPSEAERAGGSEAERAGGAGRVGALRRLRSERALSRPQSAAPGRSEKRHARCESVDVAVMPGAFGERLRAEANRLRAETEALCRDRDALRAEIRRLHEEAAKLHQESAERRKENARVVMLRDEATQLRTENADLRAEAAALRAEGAALRHENAELRGEGVVLRRSLSCSKALAHNETFTPQDTSCGEIGLSGGAYCWPEEQQLRYRLRHDGMAEDSQDEMLGDVVEMDYNPIRAGDPIRDVSWPDPAASCCPSPSRRAQRMRPISAGRYGGSFIDVSLKPTPVPPLLIPDPGVSVKDQYQQYDSESDDEDEKDEDDEESTCGLGQSLGQLQESENIPPPNVHQMSEVPEAHGNKAPAHVPVAEPCGSSARPPRAKGSHSLEVRPAGLMQCNALGGPVAPPKLCEILKEDQE